MEDVATFMIMLIIHMLETPSLTTPNIKMVQLDEYLFSFKDSLSFIF